MEKKLPPYCLKALEPDAIATMTGWGSEPHARWWVKTGILGYGAVPSISLKYNLYPINVQLYGTAYNLL